MGEERFGDYRLLEQLGRGGMGEVFRALDVRRDRVVALKRLTAELAADPEYRERFRRECRLAARLGSPHVIPIHDWGEVDGRLYLDMRLVEGRDLAAEIARVGPLGPGRAVDVVTQIAGALDSAHAADLVHRDVKPSNVLLAPDAGRDFVYLVDFGIVRAVDGGAQTSLTMTGATVGTLAYMAPELFLGTGRIDRRVDVYALGCVLHEALTGRPPFPVAGAAALMYHHVSAPPPRPSEHGAPAAFDDVVARALAKDPQQRHRSAAELGADAVRALGGGGGRPAPPSAVATTPRRPAMATAAPAPAPPAAAVVTAVPPPRSRIATAGAAARRHPGRVVGAALAVLAVAAAVVVPLAVRGTSGVPSGQVEATALRTDAPTTVVYNDPSDPSSAQPGSLGFGAEYSGVCGVVGRSVTSRFGSGSSTTWLRIDAGYVPAINVLPLVSLTGTGAPTVVRACDGPTYLSL